MSGERLVELSADEGLPRDDREKGEAEERRSGRKRVLFICTHNSARSQMAEGLLRALHGDRYEAFSAGTEPTRVHPLAIRVMAEAGIDISGQRSKSVEEFRGREFDWVVTVCDRAQQTCPFFPGGRVQLHRGFEDPAGAGASEEERLAAFRRVRDELRAWIQSAFGERGGSRGGGLLPEFRF